MSKKSHKHKSLEIQNRLKQNEISFNSHYFNVGNKKILTGLISEDLRQILIDLYRKQWFSQQKIKVNKQSKYQCQKQIVLTQEDAIELIKNTYYQLRHRPLKASFQLIKYFQNYKLSQFHSIYQNHIDKVFPSRKFLYNQIMNRIYQLKSIEKRQQNIIQQKSLNQLRLSKIAILKIQKQIFIETISFILQIYEGKKNEIRCIIVFQQSYPMIILIKNQAIQLVGESQYNKKIYNFLQIYKITLNDQNFYNPTFITCHECMRILPNIKRNQLFCKNKKSCGIFSNYYALNPYAYIQKYIKHNFFESEFPSFEHPYTTFYIQDQDQKTKKIMYKCNRYWCNQCYIRNIGQLSLDKCNYCMQFQNCPCIRCQKYRKFIIVLANFIHLKGDLKQLQKQFKFKIAFQKYNRIEIQRNHKQTQLMFEKQMKIMYLNLTLFNKNKQLTQINIISNKTFKNQNIAYAHLVLTNPNNNQFNSILFHQDTRQLKRIQKYHQQRLKKRKQYKLQNMKIKMQQKVKKLSENQKNQINQAFNEQIQQLYKRFFVSGIFIDKIKEQKKQQKSIKSKTRYQKREEQALNLNVVTVKNSQLKNLYNGNFNFFEQQKNLKQQIHKKQNLNKKIDNIRNRIINDSLNYDLQKF